MKCPRCKKPHNCETKTCTTCLQRKKERRALYGVIAPGWRKSNNSLFKQAKGEKQ